MSTAVPAACQHEAVAFSPSGKGDSPALPRELYPMHIGPLSRACLVMCVRHGPEVMWLLRTCVSRVGLASYHPPLPLATAEALSPVLTLACSAMIAAHCKIAALNNMWTCRHVSSRWCEATRGACCLKMSPSVSVVPCEWTRIIPRSSRTPRCALC
jgi:hypothetical protein